MPLLRHPTGHERRVPAAAVPYFPGWEVVEAPDIPPRSGRGSNVDAWTAYAARNAVEVAEGASREEIIAALDEAGVPTE